MSASPPPASDDSETSLVKVADSEQPAAAVVPRKTSVMDQFLMDYVKFTSNATNMDRSLKLMQWTLWLASYIQKSQGLKKLSLDLSFARYALRLLGLPASVEAARTGSWGSKTTPWLGKIMAWSMIGYYPMEHVAYLRWQAPQLLPNQNAERWSAWSCRCWLMYIVADMAQSTFKLKDMLKERYVLESNDANQDSAEGEVEVSLRCLRFVTCRRYRISNTSLSTQNALALIALNSSIRNEQLQIVRSLLFTLPAIHWSLPRWDTHPWLKESVVNGLMWTEAIVSMYQSLRSFQR